MQTGTPSQSHVTQSRQRCCNIYLERFVLFCLKDAGSVKVFNKGYLQSPDQHSASRRADDSSTRHVTLAPLCNEYTYALG